MLGTLGLDAASERVYRALLAHPDDGIPELSGHTGVPETGVRRALDVLSELGLVRPSAARAGRLRAVSPDIGMEILMARQQADLAAQLQRVEASRAAAAQLMAEYAELRPSASRPVAEQLVGPDAIHRRVAVLCEEAVSEVMAFVPDGARTAEHVAAARRSDERLLGRGLRMRTVHLDGARRDRLAVDHAAWLARLGGQVRTVPSLPTRMVITDRSTAVIPVSDDDSAGTAVVLTAKGTVTALCALFESVWETARPLGPTADIDGSGLNGQQATAIRLLSEGFTDEAIAKRLGVSPRTARRIATDLMERLGARSRFAAGVRAVQRGWLPAHD